MADTNKSYRIRTKVGSENTEEYLSVSADLIQDYDTFEVLSVNIKSTDAYRLHNSNYGVVVGRVIANNGFGIPNAKVSIFIPASEKNGVDVSNIYPFSTSVSKDRDGVRYNLLPNERVNGCHQVVGTFPSKRYALDNDVILEVFDDYYTYTTRTNNAGDYMICGVPVGTHTLHMDLDLSDCGILSQKPRDFVYKGYTVEQFESPTKFKGGTDYNNLSQVFSQDQVVNVNPFWGNDSLGETIGVSRADIDVNFKFEPTCVFIGSIVSDNASNGFSKKCVPTDNMGNMEELVTGEGKIEMIRKTPGGGVEQFSIKGDKLINADGVWCYQIPMNLDYMVTDEYGNMVPTDNPEKGIATRTSVRFRISMEDSEENTDNFFRGKVLVPHNPQIISISSQNGNIVGKHEDYDYEFGTYTKDESFRDLFWNNVYSVKSYIPRIQRANGWKPPEKNTRYTGIKHCQNYGPNNPMPYNNIRIHLPFMFTVMCVLIKTFIFISKVVNTVITFLGYVLAYIGTRKFLKISKPDDRWWINIGKWQIAWAPILPGVYRYATKMKLIVLKDGLCPDLENWFFAPMFYTTIGTGGTPKIIGEKYLNGDTGWTFGVKIAQMSGDGAPDDGIPGLHSFKYLCGCEEDNNNVPSISGATTVSGETEQTEFTEGLETPCSQLLANFNDCQVAKNYDILTQTFYYAVGLSETGQEENEDGNKPESINDDDPNSIDDQNSDTDDETHCLTTKTDYLLPCVEMNLAQEYKVINFDFYNDWINGVIYNPRWVRFKKKQVRFLWITWAPEKIKGCLDDTTVYSRNRNYVQKCSIGYKETDVNGYKLITDVDNPITYSGKPLTPDDDSIRKSNNYHKERGFKRIRVFGDKGGICHENTTMKNQKVYYLKPCEFTYSGRKINLYATDIILLGTFNDCDVNGVPQTFKHLSSTTYIMPTNLALTNMETNGPLYATSTGTICMGGNGVNAGDVTPGISYSASTLNMNISVRNQTLRGEREYFNGAGENYPNNDYDIFGSPTYGDTIPLTEAAGISWNYTGPGQGEIDEGKIYYPGGHFLGISCVNSQTNIKSCINLSRICEIGVNMSQRKENVRELTPDGQLKYTYSVPTGFISGDEIVDTDFRSMFATLNQKRLKATKRNPLTGYLIYDFEYDYPINFDGAFNKVVYNVQPIPTTPYNAGITDIEDEDLTDYGVYAGSENDDYDPEEPQNTQTRTREATSVDYYAFRFGLTHSQLKNKENIRYRFFKDNNDGKYYLPQYENSYYFYFGLKQGATALDEFNKQFYAECDDLKITKNPNLILSFDVTSFCEGNGKIRVMTEGLSLPYQSIEVVCNTTGERYVIGARPMFSAEIAVLNQETFYLPKENEIEHEFEFGKYTITVIDDDGVTITKELICGLDLFHYNYSLVNFTRPIDASGINSFNIFNGGFVLIDDFYCDYHDDDVEYSIQLKDEEEDEFVGTSEYIESVEDDIYWYLAYAPKKDTNYGLYLRYKCENGDYINIKIGTVRFSDNSYLELRIGEDGIHYETPLSDQTIMNQQSTSWWWDRDNYDIGFENGSDSWKKWFYRKMFYKQNLRGTFDSRVYGHGGRKVLWGVPQTTNAMMTMNGWSRIYCSQRESELPRGTYLNDAQTIKPTYGVNECMIADEGGDALRAGSEGNCTFNYCAQVFNGTDACGDYCYKYDKNNHYGDGELADYMGYGSNSLHEGYGCVFKPLPYGNLMFFEYNTNEELIEKIEAATTAKFGVIYPTFIYPVMKRPFFADYKLLIWNDVSVLVNISELGSRSYAEDDKDYGYGLKLNIHNGVTDYYDFEHIMVMGGNANREADYPDGYGITESSNTDRIHLISQYHDWCLSDRENYNHTLSAEISEGVPTPSQNVPELSDFARKLIVNSQFSFINNILYRLDEETNKIDYALTTNGNEYKYYIGHYSPKADNINFLESRVHGYDGKYAYKRYNLNGNDNLNDYVVLCRFKEAEGVHVSQWYTDVFVEISDVSDGDCRIYYKYLNEDGTQSTFNRLVHFYGDYTQHPYAINEALDTLYNNGTFNIDGGGQIIFPFVPVLNYKVKENLSIDGTAYDDFDSFMRRLIQKRQLMPVDHLDLLNPVSADAVIFGIGVRTIPSYAGNDITSNVYKVYPNIFRSFYTMTGYGGYDLIVIPEPHNDGSSSSSSDSSSSSSGSEEPNPYSVGKAAHDIEMTVEAESPCIIKFSMTNNGSWCSYEINGDGTNESGERETIYNGYPIRVTLHLNENVQQNNRNCNLSIKSYFGTVRDTVNVEIKQKGISESEHFHLKFEQSRYLSQNEFEALKRDQQSYGYTLRISSDDFPSLEQQEIINVYLCGVGDFHNNGNYRVFQCMEYAYNQSVPYMVSYPIQFDGHTYEYHYWNNANNVGNQFYANFSTCEIEIPENSPLNDYVIDTEFLEI